MTFVSIYIIAISRETFRARARGRDLFFFFIGENDPLERSTFGAQTRLPNFDVLFVFGDDARVLAINSIYVQYLIASPIVAARVDYRCKIHSLIVILKIWKTHGSYLEALQPTLIDEDCFDAPGKDFRQAFRVPSYRGSLR